MVQAGAKHQVVTVLSLVPMNVTDDKNVNNKLVSGALLSATFEADNNSDQNHMH